MSPSSPPYLRLGKVQSGGQVEPVRPHHVLGSAINYQTIQLVSGANLLSELFLQEFQLLRSEDSSDPLGFDPPSPAVSP